MKIWKNKRGPEIEVPFILSCTELALEYPTRLIEGWVLSERRPVRPGERMAATATWQAVLTASRVSAEVREIAGDCLSVSYRKASERRAPGLQELDGALQALSEGLEGGITKAAMLETGVEVLTWAQHAGQACLEVSAPVLRAAGLNASERMQLSRRGVSSKDQQQLDLVACWFALASWAMVCAEADGQQRLKTIGSRSREMVSCDPQCADYELLQEAQQNYLVEILADHLSGISL